MEFDFTSAEMDPLGAMFDVPTDFDWVCRPFYFVARARHPPCLDLSR
jgi:hypothetical protein